MSKAMSDRHEHGVDSPLGVAVGGGGGVGDGDTSSLSSSQKGVDACKRRRERERDTPYLPKEIIFDILVVLPADVLHDVMRHVCRDWHNIVNDPVFLRTHLSLSSTGIVVQDLKGQILYLETNNGEWKRREFAIPSNTSVVDSCNGLLLLCDWTDTEFLLVFNSITKTIVFLPQLIRSCKFCRHNSTTLACSSSGQCKAVNVQIESDSEVRVRVCAVGIDKAWRQIDIGNVPISKSLVNVIWRGPVSNAAGFIFWVDSITLFGLILNVADETMHQFVPPDCGFLSTQYTLLPLNMGTSFGLAKSVNKGYMEPWIVKLWEVWELTDVKSGKWTKVLNIDMVQLDRRLELMFRPRPYNYSKMFYYSKKEGELWLRSSVDMDFTLVCWNVKNGDILTAIDILHCDFSWYPHVNSLL